MMMYQLMSYGQVMTCSAGCESLGLSRDLVPGKPHSLNQSLPVRCRIRGGKLKWYEGGASGTGMCWKDCKSTRSGCTVRSVWPEHNHTHTHTHISVQMQTVWGTEMGYNPVATLWVANNRGPLPKPLSPASFPCRSTGLAPRCRERLCFLYSPVMSTRSVLNYFRRGHSLGPGVGAWTMEGFSFISFLKLNYFLVTNLR